MKKLLALLLVALFLAGCTSQSSDMSPGESATAAAVRNNYDQFLTALGKNGWAVSADDQFTGSINGVQSIVQNCRVWLRLTKTDPLTYVISAVNGHDVNDVFGEEIGKQISQENISTDRFEQVYQAVPQNERC